MEILVAFAIFAGAVLFFIFKAGDKIEMQGVGVVANRTEVHGASTEVDNPRVSTSEKRTDK